MNSYWVGLYIFWILEMKILNFITHVYLLNVLLCVLIVIDHTYLHTIPKLDSN